MALTEKERARIIDEETLRYETRRQLCKQGGHGRRWWWWALAALVLWVVCLRPGTWCRGHSGCTYGHGGWGAHGGCKHHGQMWQHGEGEDEGEDEDEGKKAPAPAPKK